ncbi:MAG: hypothetical protein HY711_05200, partial [Candidatus Melainabacteria bacterium]|nr:hypothetical protein [Candidatus Melainabacteria bacterium]
MSTSRRATQWLPKITLSICATWLWTTTSLSAQQVTASDSQGINLTIYNQDFGLVKDIRTVDLKDGVNYLRFEDVSAMIDPTSVNFTSLTAPNAVTVREQNYQYDLMDPTTILSKSVGKTIKCKQVLANGQVEELTGILLNQPVATVSDTQGNVLTRHQGLVLKTTNGIVLNPSGEIHLQELPTGLVSKPSLWWKLESNKAGKHQTEITYQTGGLNWRCDYVVVSNVDDTSADLTSWVTIDNKSGATYKSASLKLLAGDVHKIEPRVLYRAKAELRAAESMAPQFKEQAFAEYHLYTLQGKTDVNQNETKQLSLFSVNSVPTKKLFIFEPAAGEFGYGIWHREDSQKIQVKLEIQNTEANHLGLPMPKGKIRVYKRDQDNALQFVGEDMIDHTPR